MSADLGQGTDTTYPELDVSVCCAVLPLKGHTTGLPKKAMRAVVGIQPVRNNATSSCAQHTEGVRVQARWLVMRSARDVITVAINDCAKNDA
jgi:hypothetical protein